MSNIRITGMALAGAAALALVSCTASSDEQQGGGSSGPDLSGEKLEIAGVWSGEEQQNFEEVLALFEERTGAEVTYTSSGDDLPTVLQTRVDGSSPPNVAILPQPGLIEHFAAADALVPLSEETKQRADENYSKLWRDLGTVGDEQYAVYVKATNKSTFWYNVPLFEEVGVAPPRTIEDLTHAAGLFADSGIGAISVGGADGWVLTDWFENIYLQVAGPEMYDKLSAHEIPWTHPSVKETLSVMGDVLSDRYLAGGSDGALQTEFATSVSNVYGDDPQAAMVYEGDFVAGVIASSTGARLGEDAQFFPFPQIDGGAPSVVVGGDGAVAFTDDAATAQLMTFLASPDAAEVWAAKGGFLSPNKALSTDVYPDELTKQTAEQLLDAGENVRFDMSDIAPSAFGATKGAGMWKDLQDFVANPDDVEGTMRKLEKHAASAY